MKRGIIVLFHGSRTRGSVDAVKSIIRGVQAKRRRDVVAAAFLQHGAPSFMKIVQSYARQDVRDITAVPFFLQLGTHVTRDIPDLLGTARQCYPDIRFTLTNAVGTHPKMVDIIADLAKRVKRKPK